MDITLSRRSQGPLGQGFNNASDFAALSADGTWLVFQTEASNSFLSDSNGWVDIWRQNRADGALQRVSLTGAGTATDGASFGAATSADGRHIAFTSIAANMLAEDMNGMADIFRRDMETGALLLISINSDGRAGNNVSFGATITGDGSKLAFLSAASDLVTADTNNAIDVFLRDLSANSMRLVSTAADGSQGNAGALNRPAISADGRFVAFDSLASNLLADDSNGRDDVFLKDMLTGAVTRVSTAADGTQQNGGIQGTLRPVISADGRYVAFASSASNLVAGDTNNAIDVFRRDMLTGAIERVSITAGGVQGQRDSLDATISADGRFIAFTSLAPDFAADDRPASADIFLKDMQSGALMLLSRNLSGVPGLGESVNAAISADGLRIAFASTVADLVAGDANAWQDMFEAALPRPSDAITGTSAADALHGTAGADTILGLAGDDWLRGHDGDDRLEGGADADTLDGSAGADLMLGGPGHDQYVIRDAADRVIEAEEAGTDTAWVLLAGWTLPAHVEIGRLFGAANQLTGGDQGVQLVAGSGPSTLIGGAGDDVLWGGAHGDLLEGGAGADTLRGGTGADMMRGGTGHDHFIINNSADMVEEAADAGIDTAWVTANGWVMPAHVEIARLSGGATSVTGGGLHQQLVASPLLASTLIGGAGDDVLWGDAHGDLLEGGAGADTLRGGTGADMMRGGTGHDHFIINNSGDMVEEADDAGIDTAWVAIDDWALPAGVELAYLSGAARRVAGGEGAEQLIANPVLGGVLEGRGGTDTLWGSNAGDVLAGGAADDVLYGFGGADRFVFDLPGWGRDQVADFTRAQGDRIDMRGSGVTSFAQFTVVTGDGHTALRLGANEIMLFNTTGVTAADFLFS